jgi:hypothetical protein
MPVIALHTRAPGHRLEAAAQIGEVAIGVDQPLPDIIKVNGRFYVALYDSGLFVEARVWHATDFQPVHVP